jgi:hypothetical protein
MEMKKPAVLPKLFHANAIRILGLEAAVAPAKAAARKKASDVLF